MSYSDFLARKASRVEQPGRVITLDDVNPTLHPWQAELVQWAVRTSRAAIWADTGLGKTFMQIEWTRLSAQVRGLIVAPLAVCAQTVREGEKLGVPIKYVRSMNDACPFNSDTAIYITNYEMVPQLDPNAFDAVALDESSILKQSDGGTTRLPLPRLHEAAPPVPLLPGMR